MQSPHLPRHQRRPSRHRARFRRSFRIESVFRTDPPHIPKSLTRTSLGRFPPAAPPDGVVGIRTYSPNTNEVPTLNAATNKFAITCQVDGCGEPLSVFETASQLNIVAMVQDFVDEGIYASSACAYECDREVFSHALDTEAYQQLVTTSTLSVAQFAYGRLTTTQTGVDETPGANAGFTSLDKFEQLTDVSMDECSTFFTLRKLIAMHAVWLVDDETVSPATGTCTLFLATRDQHQLTLWQSFFEHARRVVSIGHFQATTPANSNAAIARPSSGLSCDPSLQTTGTALGGGINTRTEWRACLWWSEFSHDTQNEYACSPDRVRPQV